jgi:hypothetical protein
MIDYRIKSIIRSIELLHKISNLPIDLRKSVLVELEEIWNDGPYGSQIHHLLNCNVKEHLFQYELAKLIDRFKKDIAPEHENEICLN